MGSDVIKTKYGDIKIVKSDQVKRDELILFYADKIIDESLSYKERLKYVTKAINIGGGNGLE